MNAAQKKPRATAASSTASQPIQYGDATLARYFSDLSAYELLTRDTEIALAQDVERLEVAYWHALLAWPRVFTALKPGIAAQVPEVDAELRTLSRAATRAAHSHASAAVRATYDRAALKLATKLRQLDIHRDFVKQAQAAAEAFCEPEGPAQGRQGRIAKPTKAMQRYLSAVQAARRAQQDAKDRFVAANLRLVVSMARRYARGERMPLSDLIQEGNLGLMKAVERFDFRRGFRFSTYASWWIRHALTRGMADKARLVRLPVHALETRARVARETRKAFSSTGVRPTHAQLVEATGLPLEKILACEELSVESHLSLDAPVGSENERTFLDLLCDNDQMNAEELVLDDGRKQSLSHMMQDLSPFEAQILRYRFGFDGGEERTLKEIGDMYNLSRERIRQIQAAALAKMRRSAEDNDVEPAAS